MTESFSPEASSASDLIDLSYSRLRTYERCPWMYHLVYKEGWRAGPNAPQAFGHSLHRTLAAFLSSENTERTLERLFEIYDENWVNEGFETPEQTFERYEKGKIILENFFKLNQQRTTQVLATELELSVPLSSSLVLRASLDRLDRHADGSYEVVEYKTQETPWPQARVDSDLQMTIYDVATRHKFQTNDVKLTFFFLAAGLAVSTHRSEDQRREAVLQLQRAGEKINRKIFEPNFLSCPKCEFRTRCTKAKK